MDKNKILSSISEAKHSFAVFTSMIGNNSKANILYIKWVDAMESLVAENEKQFFDDMSILICQPLCVVAEALNQRASELGASNSEMEINDTMRLMSVDPVAAKQNLLRICNSQIFKLKAVGLKYDYIKTSEGLQP